MFEFVWLMIMLFEIMWKSWCVRAMCDSEVVILLGHIEACKFFYYMYYSCAQCDVHIVCEVTNFEWKCLTNVTTKLHLTVHWMLGKMP